MAIKIKKNTKKRPSAVHQAKKAPVKKVKKTKKPARKKKPAKVRRVLKRKAHAAAAPSCVMPALPLELPLKPQIIAAEPLPAPAPIAAVPQAVSGVNWQSEAETAVAIPVKSFGAAVSPHILNLKKSTPAPTETIFEPASFIKPRPMTPVNIEPPVNYKAARLTAKNRYKLNVDFAANQGLRARVAAIIRGGVDFWRWSNWRQKLLPPAPEYVYASEPVEDIFARPDCYFIGNLAIPRNWYRKVAVFAVFALILVLPLQAFTYYQELLDTKDRVLIATDRAIDNLKAGSVAATRLDLNRADSEFDLAKLNFVSAQGEVDQLNNLTTEILKIIPGLGGTISSGVSLLEAGEIVAETGKILVDSGRNFMSGDDLNNYFSSLIKLRANLAAAMEKFAQAKEKIENIKPSDLPEKHQATFAKVLTYLPQIESGLGEINRVNEALIKALGNEHWQRYMLVFVNNNELRAGGGFMGSFALVDIDRGQIKNMEIPGGGTYDIQGQLIPKVIAPQPLHLINSRWEFQDANWWSDYPSSAKKIQWFYKNAGGPTVDGVITITSTMMERLLEVFGPIPMPEYGREITSANFVEETQKIVELEYDKEKNRPKQFLGDMAPKLIEKIFQAKGPELEKLFEILKTGLNQKQILIYFSDAQLENILSDFGWSGKLAASGGDYLSVVHTNVAGGKTDRVIKDKIEHWAQIGADGSIVDTVKLTRSHAGVSGENVFTGVQNNSYIRFYVPAGSLLLEAQGFKRPPDNFFESPKPDYQTDVDLISIEGQHFQDENSQTDIYTENGKTVFGNWLMLKAGETASVTLKYKLPFKLALQGENTFYYSLLVQKQPGAIGSELISNLVLDSQFKPLAKFPADMPSTDSNVNFSALLTTDQFYGTVLIKR